MNIIQFIFVIACLVGSCSGQDESYEYVLGECNHRLQRIDSIEKFQRFLQQFKVLIADREKPKKGLLNLQGKLRECYDLEEPLLELEVLIESRHGNICKIDYIERLASFHLKYLQVKKTYLRRFFSLYAHQIAFTCKCKLRDRILVAQKQQDCSSVISNFIPSASSLDSNMEAGKDMIEVANFLRHFKRVEDFAPILKLEKPNSLKPFFDVMIPNALVEKIESLKQECRSKEPYYMALFSPIAALAQLGYSVDALDEDVEPGMGDDNEKLSRCWLAAAQLCQGILLTHLTPSGDLIVDPDLKSKFMSIKWGPEPNSPNAESQATNIPLILDDTIEEISPNIISLLDKKSTLAMKLKSKMMSWAKKIIEHHIDLEATQTEATRKFLEALTSQDNGIDSKIAFAGKKFDDKKFNPTSIMTDDADTFVMYSSPLWNKEVGLLVSSIIAVAMSAVFVWFSLYAIVTTIKQQYFSIGDHSNFKTEWKELRDKRVHKIEGKFSKKKAMLNVYKPI